LKIKSKHKGHLMIDILFSIALLGMIATVLLPNIINLLQSQKHIKEREDLINAVNSCSEEITGNFYHTREIKYSEPGDDITIRVDNNKKDKLNHVLVTGTKRGLDEEIQIEFYLWDEGLLTD